MAESTPISWKIIAAFVGIYFVWGSTYLAIALALEGFPPFTLAGIRFFTAGFLLFLFCKYKRQKITSVRAIFRTSVIGILLLLFGSGSVIWVEQYLPTGLTSIVWAFLPIWLIVLDYNQWKQYFKNKWLIAGLIIGFAGIVLLFSDKTALDFNNRDVLINFFIAIGGTILFSIGSLLAKYGKKIEMATTMKAAIQMMVAGAVSILVAFLIGETDQVIWSEISFNAIWGLFFLIFFGSIVAYLSYVWLLEKVSPAIVGTYTYINPLIAVFLGWSILGETISPKQLIALTIVLTGVILANINKPAR
ncbi:EamA family transporter [Salmonirosea aquatica]|uniref:EamA family transporter n=1 Tax=Salmonirosea aquatica TaxID=2654236 RepID=A0A7C9FEU3_9BACT|nr:EamA family transporter [Cytophagaceae bacterium SJW1-29]